ncbi:MAG: hypothetical protein ACK50J_13115 [Planctomyces sp.]
MHDETRRDENNLTANCVEKPVITDTNNYGMVSAATDRGVQGGRGSCRAASAIDVATPGRLSRSFALPDDCSRPSPVILARRSALGEAM